MPATTIAGTLVDLIKNSAHLASLIGSGDTARIYPVRIPQDEQKDENGHALPSIAFNQVSADRVSAFGTDTGLCRSRYQFSCWAETLDDALGLANGLRLTLQRYRDLTGTNGVVIQDCFILTDNQQYDEAVASFGVLVDYEVIWQEGNS